ncbi:MAG: NAD(+)/NADH kinase [Elusimicrobia bacterium]|nr:NAD(+)/NADH kinase [Candidatus Liberimonas magnetica]
MKKVGIIFNTEKKKAKEELQKLTGALENMGCKVIPISSSNQNVKNLDFALTLGGDGTMLKASRMLSIHKIPVLGINLGALGFMAETDSREVYSLLPAIVEGSYKIQKRMMLDITIKTGKKTIKHLALNDIIIHSGSKARVITITAKVNDEFIGDYIGDGLIVSSPTGSTAYSLAANGPIVHPNLSLFILTPICPHTLTQRPLIISSKYTINLSMDPKNKQSESIVSIDGQINYELGINDLIFIKEAKNPLKLIVNPNSKYLKVLRTKLKWGERG